MDEKIEEIVKKLTEDMPKEKKKELKEFINDSRTVKSELYEGRTFKPRRLAEIIMNRDNFKTLSNDDTLLIYNNGIYHDNGETKVKELVEDIMLEDITTHQVNETINHIKRSTYINPEEINKRKKIIHLKNGIYDLDKKELRDFDPEIISTVQLPVKYDPEGECPKIKKFLSEVLDEKDIPIIQELFGYCLLKDYFVQKAFMFIGEGSNGKSTLINLFKRFLGRENISNISLQDLCYSRFAKVALFGKLVNLYADIPKNPIKDTGTFKMLTGGDPIEAEVKFKQKRRKFTNYAKLIFSANQIPDVKDKSDAFFRRWIIINFPNKFEGENCDKKILEKITTEKEISGLFNWALEGLERLLERERFSYSKSTEEIRIDYEKKANSLKAFINDCVGVSGEDSIVRNVLFTHYVDYCKKHNLPIKSKTVVSRELPEHIPVTDGRKTDEFGKEQRAWVGIRVIGSV